MLIYVLDRDNLCLFGLPSGEWRVSRPVDEVPSELPEPTLGINFARNGMPKKDWLNTVAAHSDSWLLALAFFFACTFGFDKADRYVSFSYPVPCSMLSTFVVQVKFCVSGICFFGGWSLWVVGLSD